MNFHPLDFLSRPLVAVTTSVSSVIVSLLPHLESGLRLSTLALGFFVAALAARKAWRDR